MNFEHSELIIANSASLVLKNSSILVFYLSQEGKIVYANNKFIEEIGLSQAELFTTSIFELSPHLTSSVWMMMISSNIDVNYTLTFALRSMNG
jgi:PAS domain S-box-containing protein